MGSINVGFNDLAADNGDTGFATGPLDDSGFFSGILSAPLKGAWQGARAVSNLMPDVPEFAKAPLQTIAGPFAPAGVVDLATQAFNAVDPETRKQLFDDNIDALDKWSKNSFGEGFGASLVRGAAKGLTEFAAGSLIGGPLGGAAMLGAAEGHDEYTHQVEQGVDKGTAAVVGGVTGVLNAAAAALPFKLGGIAENLRLSALGSEIAGNATTAQFLSKIADNVLPESTIQGAVQSGVAMMGQYAGGTYLNSEILRSQGYEEQAKQLDPFDLKMLAAQFVMGSAFHALGRMGEKPTPTELDTAVDTLREGQIKNSSPVVPIDGDQAAAAGDALTIAAEQMRRGDTVDVPSELSAKVLESEAANPAHTDPALVLDGMARSNPDIDVSPIKMLAGEEPVVLERPPTPPTEGAAETAVKPISPIAEEQLKFLEDNLPNYEVNLGEQKVPVSELRLHIEGMVKADQERVKIYDIAAACSLRNEGIPE